MSYKKLENRTPDWWRIHHETLAQMRQWRWDVTSRCSKCGLHIRLDIDLTIRVFGPHISLWNHSQSCARVECVGYVRFWARPPELLQPFELTAQWPAEREPGWWLDARELKKVGLS